MLSTYNVTFFNGQSRQQPGKGCDYMVSWIEDEDGEPVELYAEALEPEGFAVDDMAAWDCFIFTDLKAEIIRQANGYGITAEQLEF